MDLSPFDFHLPEGLIARYPAEKRDGSRLLHVDRGKSQWTDFGSFREIASLLRPGDVLVYNETKVSPRRIFLQSRSGRRHEALFLEPRGRFWIVLLKNRSKTEKGQVLSLEGGAFAFTVAAWEEEFVLLEPEREISEEDFSRWGEIPIPPYLQRKAEEIDSVRYQTIFAKEAGSVAAPTAGLHFTEELKAGLERQGIAFVPVLLRVGYGTFRPLTGKQMEEKRLHREEINVSKESAEILSQKKQSSGRILAVGTTSLRTLETMYDPEKRQFRSGKAETELFLMPGDRIQSIDGLITNFHLPKSSLILLVACFAGRDLVLSAYEHAVEQEYRFFSYGDAMFLT